MQGIPAWGRILNRKIAPRNCAQFCAQHQPGRSCTGEQGGGGSPVDHYSMQLSASASLSVQVIDSLCSNGYEPEGREFESLRAHHLLFVLTNFSAFPFLASGLRFFPVPRIIPGEPGWWRTASSIAPKESGDGRPPPMCYQRGFLLQRPSAGPFYFTCISGAQQSPRSSAVKRSARAILIEILGLPSLTSQPIRT